MAMLEGIKASKKMGKLSIARALQRRRVARSRCFWAMIG